MPLGPCSAAMANRVLVRCVRVLYKNSSQAPAVTSRLFPIMAAEVHRSPVWASAGDKFKCGEEKTIKTKYGFLVVPKYSQLDEMICTATEPEEVLAAWEKYPGDSNHAAIAFKTWAFLVKKTKGDFDKQPAELLEDPRVKDMMTMVSKEVSYVWNNALVSVLQALWAMNLHRRDFVLQSIQTETLWRIRRLSLKQLAYLISSGADRKEPQDVAIINAALKQLELRWTEVADAQTIRVLIRSGECLSPTLLDKIEEKALEHAESFSSSDIRHICASMAAQNRRSVPLLRALSYHLLQKPSLDFTNALMIDMAFAYGKLNFHHTQILQRMASELLPRVTLLHPAEVVSLAKSFGFVKWLHHSLFEAFTENYISNNEKYSLLQLSNLLMTFARLGFQPSKRDEFYATVHPSLEDSLSQFEPLLQTDVAWSLCVLQQARPQYLIPLLQEPHLSTTLLKDSNLIHRENYSLKLLHIAATLQLEHPGSFNTEASDTGSTLAAHAYRGPSSTLTPLQTSLREILHSLVNGRTDAICFGVDTVYGWTIDGVMVVDSDNKPVSLLPFNDPHLPNGKGEEPLPLGAQRIAFLAWEFTNFILKSKDLLGRFVMMKRHLQLAGFIIVEVPYFDWLQLTSNYQKVSYLKDKIGKAVAEDMAK